jgi:omega-amidase
LAKTLTVGAFQFAACSDVSANLAAIERAMKRARDRGVRLLLTQECSLCGYPPQERDAAASVDQNAQLEALERIESLARQCGLFVVVGLITARGPSFLNSVCLVRPDGAREPFYHKRALWGWDAQSYVPGEAGGMYEVDGIRVGTRICYEARFPEYFREFFREQVDLALVSLATVGDASDSAKADVYRAHLVSRASENAMWVLSANSTSQAQLARSCLIDPDGNVTAECSADEEDLLVGVVTLAEPGFSAKGRIALSRALTGRSR